MDKLPWSVREQKRHELEDRFWKAMEKFNPEDVDADWWYCDFMKVLNRHYPLFYRDTVSR